MIESAVFVFKRVWYRVLVDENEGKFSWTVIVEHGGDILSKESSGFLYSTDQSAMLAAIKEITTPEDSEVTE